MDFRKKCLYLAVASVFTAQTAFAQASTILESAFITKELISQAIATQTPLLLDAIDRAISTAEPVAGEGITVSVNPTTRAPTIALKDFPRVGDMRLGGMIAYVDATTGEVLVVDLRRDGIHSKMWSSVAATRYTVSQWGYGGGCANTAIAAGVATATNTEAPAAAYVQGINVDDAGRTCAAPPVTQEDARAYQCNSGFAVGSPGDMFKIVGNLEEVNAGLKVLGGTQIGDGLYMTSYTDPLTNLQTVFEIADGKVALRQVVPSFEAMVLPVK